MTLVSWVDKNNFSHFRPASYAKRHLANEFVYVAEIFISMTRKEFMMIHHQIGHTKYKSSGWSGRHPISSLRSTVLVCFSCDQLEFWPLARRNGLDIRSEPPHVKLC